MKYLKKIRFSFGVVKVDSVWWIILVHQNECPVKKITISYSLKLYIFRQCTDIVYKYIWNMGYGNILREVNVFLFPYIKDHWMVIYQFYADCKPKMAISVEKSLTCGKTQKIFSESRWLINCYVLRIVWNPRHSQHKSLCY